MSFAGFSVIFVDVVNFLVTAFGQEAETDKPLDATNLYKNLATTTQLLSSYQYSFFSLSP
jgi:hypothetical protein